jgi:hypothetical protein
MLLGHVSTPILEVSINERRALLPLACEISLAVKGSKGCGVVIAMSLIDTTSQRAVAISRYLWLAANESYTPAIEDEASHDRGCHVISRQLLGLPDLAPFGKLYTSKGRTTLN